MQPADNREWSDIRDGEAVSSDSRFEWKNATFAKALWPGGDHNKRLEMIVLGG